MCTAGRQLLDALMSGSRLGPAVQEQRYRGASGACIALTESQLLQPGNGALEFVLREEPPSGSGSSGPLYSWTKLLLLGCLLWTVTGSLVLGLLALGLFNLLRAKLSYDRTSELINLCLVCLMRCLLACVFCCFFFCRLRSSRRRRA